MVLGCFSNPARYNKKKVSFDAIKAVNDLFLQDYLNQCEHSFPWSKIPSGACYTHMLNVSVVYLAYICLTVLKE